MNMKLIRIKILLVGIVGVLLLSGCAVGYMNSYTHEPKTGRSVKTVYSPLFVSESMLLAEGAEFKVSVVITRRVEPISYALVSSVGGLTSDDLVSTATAMLHFKNNSKMTYKIEPKVITILHQNFSVSIPEIVLKPKDRLDTKVVAVKVPTYDTDFMLGLMYNLDGKPGSQIFTMKRQNMEDLKRR